MSAKLVRSFAVLALILVSLPASFPAQAQVKDARFDLAPHYMIELLRDLFSRNPVRQTEALDILISRGRTDVVPGMILALRQPGDTDNIWAALRILTGEKLGPDWKEWMLWQERHPEIVPFSGFDVLVTDVLASIDQRFMDFIYPTIAHEIRLEEIVWGGVGARDGIPALNYPDQIPAAEADYLSDDELVFGVSINGDTRAYPLRIMDWHEMFNDTVGRVHLALAYCTLCGSGILYETLLPGRDKPIIFGSSGLLYRSNKLMYDPETNSLWNQFTGRPVVGELTGSGIELKVRPVAITSWRDWRTRHPDTTVLSLETGHVRDYTPGRPYGPYFASPDLMFPATLPDDTLQAKDYVFGLRLGTTNRAWPLAAFAGGRIIHDRVDGLDIVLIGDAATRTVRAYRSGGLTFAPVNGDLQVLTAGGGVWRVEEEAIVGLGGEVFARLPGHIAYWFAWSNFLRGAPLQEPPQGVGPEAQEEKGQEKEQEAR